MALPAYDRLRADGVDEGRALLQVLLHLLAVNDDTNLVSRGGLEALDYVRDYAAKLLQQGGVLARDGLARMLHSTMRSLRAISVPAARPICWR